MNFLEQICKKIVIIVIMGRFSSNDAGLMMTIMMTIDDDVMTIMMTIDDDVMTIMMTIKKHTNPALLLVKAPYDDDDDDYL